MLRAPQDSFVGSHTNKVDGKGRVAAPADFRNALDRDAFNGFFCLPSLQGPFLECGGPDFVGALKAMIAALPPYDKRRRALEVHLIGKAKPIKFDGEGRFVLPEHFRKHADIDGLAFFLGVGDTFQIWRAEGVEEEIAASIDIAREALSDLENPMSFYQGEVRP